MVGSFCQGRGMHSAHSSCCSVTMRVFGRCSKWCCGFFFVLPCPVPVCSVRQAEATPHRFVCIGSFWAHLMVLGFHLRCCFQRRHNAALCLLGLWLRFVVWKVEGEGVVSDLSSRYGSHCPNVGHVLLKVWCVSMAPLHCGSPIWLAGAAVFGTPLWSVSLGLGFGGVGGASPPCVGAPVCGWCVCGVDLSDTLPYCSP